MIKKKAKGKAGAKKGATTKNRPSTRRFVVSISCASDALTQMLAAVVGYAVVPLSAFRATFGMKLLEPIAILVS